MPTTRPLHLDLASAQYKYTPSISLSPVTNNMPQSSRTVSQESAEAIRKRVCKACDRCRLKKSKCDGSSPCSRCKADNAICVFGERKKSHDKIYPKGYVEMLEQQQGQLVQGLQVMYRQLRTANAWKKAKLEETNGQPLTHDILAALEVLEPFSEDHFEEDTEKLQQRLISQGSGDANRRTSVSSDSDHSQHSNSRNASAGTPASSKNVFRESFAFHSEPPSPAPQPKRQRQSLHQPIVSQPSPLHHHNSPLSNDPQLFQPEWQLPDMSTRSQFQPQQQQRMPDLFQDNFGFDGMTSNYDVSAFMNQQHMGPYSQSPVSFNAPMQANPAFVEAMDMDFNQYITPTVMT
ncbi:Hypothetical protein R9X50_00083600 [Acrodontium crateriforme]|uniref:Zn(2)-C6 fungal-type domain-containing protein n=1 Tax=Acrodontium crateriforme TaxID=150365 RepID=A0AAQ3LYK7_9PEZI|nr:Hypothetical protein R9X50_00083600 [Acrodontium crateriforme]